MSSMKPSEWAILVLLSVFWGGSFFFAEIALLGFQPFAIVFQRVAIAALILVSMVYLGGLRMPSSAGAWGAYFVLGALNNAIPLCLIVWGQTHIDNGRILNWTRGHFNVRQKKGTLY